MKRLRMLIVEDEFLSRNLLASLMAERGSADVAVDGEEAVRAVKYAYDSGTPYDVIFLDIMLPVMDGQEALRRIRDYERERGLHAPEGCKVVMTTALSDARNVMDAFKGQCEAYIVKPYNKPKIEEQLRSIGLLDRP